MTTFRFTSPEGKTYNVTGPEGATAEDAFKILQTQLGTPSPQSMPENVQGPSFGENALDTARVAGTAAVQGVTDTLNIPSAVAGLAGPVEGLSSDFRTWLRKQFGMAPQPEIEKMLTDKATKAGEATSKFLDVKPLVESAGLPTDARKEAQRLGADTDINRAIAGAVRTGTGAFAFGAGRVGAGVAALGAGLGQELGGDTGEAIGAIGAPFAVPAAAASLRSVMRGANPATLRAAISDAELAGMPISVGQGTERRLANMAESATGKFGGTTAAADFAARQIQGAKGTVADAASAFAPIKGEYGTALDAIEGARSAVDRLKGQADTLFAKRRAMIPGDTPADAVNVIDFLKAKATPAPGAEATVNPFFKKNAANLERAATGTQLGNQFVTVDALRAIKDRAGQMSIPTAGILTIDKGAAKQLGGIINQAILDAVPPSVAKAASAIDRWYAGNPKANVFGAKDRINQIYAKPVIDVANEPAKALGNIMGMARSAPDRFRNFMRGLPGDAANSVRSHLIASMGVVRSGEFQIGQFVRDWRALPDRTKLVLFEAGGRADLRQKFEAIARNYERIAKGSRVMANPSGTAGTLMNIGAASSFGGAILHGNVGQAATIAAVFGSAYLTQKLMTSQPFIKWLARSTTIPPANLAQSLNAVIAAEKDPETKAALRAYQNSLPSQSTSSPARPIRGVSGSVPMVPAAPR